MPTRRTESEHRPRGRVRPIRAAVLSTGAEILQGLYADTNAQWLAERLDALGYDVVALRAAGDGTDQIVTALRSFSGEADLVLSTGGLGPTEDDSLRAACARLWRAPLRFQPTLMRQIQARFRRLGREMPESNRRQAFIPRGAEPLSNRWGTAPGFVMRGRGTLPTLIALPGPPVEMRPMFEERALPWLMRHLRPSVARGRTVIHTLGWSEARVNEAIHDLFTADPTLQVTILARAGKIDVRLTVTAASAAAVRRGLARWSREVLSRLPPEIVYGRDEDSLEAIVQRLLAARGWTIAVAESCTGGLVAERLTRIPGASKTVHRCVVTYADEAKRRVLGVRAATLRRHGAVSEACVREMAEGVRRWAHADIGLGISGIAGPTGGTPEKPVGLVWVAAATARGTVAERHLIVRREREAIRGWAADRALNLARRVLSEG